MGLVTGLGSGAAKLGGRLIRGAGRMFAGSADDVADDVARAATGGADDAIREGAEGWAGWMAREGTETAAKTADDVAEVTSKALGKLVEAAKGRTAKEAAELFTKNGIRSAEDLGKAGKMLFGNNIDDLAEFVANSNLRGAGIMRGLTDRSKGAALGRVAKAAGLEGQTHIDDLVKFADKVGLDYASEKAVASFAREAGLNSLRHGTKYTRVFAEKLLTSKGMTSGTASEMSKTIADLSKGFVWRHPKLTGAGVAAAGGAYGINEVFFSDDGQEFRIVSEGTKVGSSEQARILQDVKTGKYYDGETKEELSFVREYVNPETGMMVDVFQDSQGNTREINSNETQQERAARRTHEEARENEGPILGLIRKIPLYGDEWADKLHEWGVAKFLTGKLGAIVGGLALLLGGNIIGGMAGSAVGASVGFGGDAVGSLLSTLLPIAGVAIAGIAGIGMLTEKGKSSGAKDQGQGQAVGQGRGVEAPERDRTPEVGAPEQITDLTADARAAADAEVAAVLGRRGVSGGEEAERVAKASDVGERQNGGRGPEPV